MPKYTCINEECPRYKMTTVVLKSRIRIKNGKSIDTGSICPKCGEIMESNNPGFTTMMGGGENVCKK